jgi:hypothetical protein
MPKSYVQNEIDKLLDCGASEFDRIEGIIYQDLHRLFPQEGYAQMAYDAFSQGANKQSLSDRTESEILICQADAALAIRDLDEYARCLREGLLIAFQINSKKRQDEARKVLSKAPNGWKQETTYQNVVKMF